MGTFPHSVKCFDEIDPRFIHTGQHGLAGTGRMTDMLSLATRYRRPSTVALGIVAGLCLVLVAAALWNPWRMTALYPLATTGGAIATLTLAGALVAMASLLTLADTGRRALVALVVGLVAVPALCVGVPAVAFDGVFRDKKVTAVRVLATSPEGGYSVVAVTLAPDSRVMLLVRSRQLLLSRESATPVAECPRDPFADEVPPTSVRFTGETTVTVPIEGASTVTVTFDPASLEPARTVAMCDQTTD